LLARSDVDFVELVRETAFLQHHGNLAAVGRAPGVELDHRSLDESEAAQFIVKPGKVKPC